MGKATTLNDVASRTDESGFDESAYDFSVDEFFNKIFEMTDSLVAVCNEQSPALFATTGSMMCLAAEKAVKMFRAENPDTSLTAGDMANVAAMRGSTVNLLERIVDRIALGYKLEPWEKKLAKDPLWKDDPVKNAADLLTGFRYLDRLVGDDLFGLARLNMIIDAAYNVRGADLMCVARIVDGNANELLLTGAVTDTSPAVSFAPGTGKRITVDGKLMLIEGVPALCDHLCICPKGTWTRDGAPGVKNQLTEASA